MNYPLVYISVTDENNQLVIDGNLDLLRQFFGVFTNPTDDKVSIVPKQKTKSIDSKAKRSAAP